MGWAQHDKHQNILEGVHPHAKIFVLVKVYIDILKLNL